MYPTKYVVNGIRIYRGEFDWNTFPWGFIWNKQFYVCETLWEAKHRISEFSNGDFSGARLRPFLGVKE